MRHDPLLKKIAAPCAALVITALWLLPVLAQGPASNLADPAFTQPMALSVPFKHNEHNTKAKIVKCTTCHHDFTTGKRVMTGKSVTERRCSACHNAQPGPDDTIPGLMTAYHTLCQDCHRAKGQGPLKCSECHVKQANPS